MTNTDPRDAVLGHPSHLVGRTIGALDAALAMMNHLPLLEVDDDGMARRLVELRRQVERARALAEATAGEIVKYEQAILTQQLVQSTTRTR